MLYVIQLTWGTHPPIPIRDILVKFVLTRIIPTDSSFIPQMQLTHVRTHSCLLPCEYTLLVLHSYLLIVQKHEFTIFSAT